jgi:N-acetyl-anhydromuramyl-L-alanine amidase AmpD
MPLAKSPHFAYDFGMRPGSIRVALALATAAMALVASGSGEARPSLSYTFREAARAFHVPARLLLAVGYANTRWRMPAGPALNGGFGTMDLTPAQLRRAAAIAGIDPELARHDLRENVHAGAALLSTFARRSSESVFLNTNSKEAWHDAVARIWGAPLADELLGRTGRQPASAPAADYPGARWLPATRSDYAVANRPLSDRIRMVVIHTTDGSYSGTLSWFRNPAAQASAHYVVRSSDGQITQMVREKDEAWHAGNGTVNATSIGIEHEAFTTNCAWYTDSMYRSSAQLVAYLVTKYLIPVDRTHIIGHYQVPDPNHPGQFGGFAHHTDPGPCWNWPKYMSLVRDFAGASVGTTVQRIADDSSRTFTGPRGWRRTTSAAAYGRSYAVTAPNTSGKDALFGLRLPLPGRYAVYGWWPAGPTRNSSVPVGIETTSGRQWIKVDERTGGGWTYLGTFPLATRSTVRFSPRTSTTGSIAADAVKVELLAPHPGSRLEAAAEGWAATARGLSSTRDGGASWSKVSPGGIAPEQIRGVHLAGDSGWIVVATGNAKRPLALYRTASRGLTWTVSPLAVPADVDVAAPVSVEPVDDTHAFIGLRLEPGRWSLSRGLLLRTSDGGTTWAKTALPAGGNLSFPTTRDGWLVGGLAHERLYASHDGGKTWKQVVPRPAITGAASTAYSLPTFTSATEGVLPVSLAAGARSTLAFQTTVDGGRSWQVDGLVRIGKSLRVAASVPTAIVDSSLWLAAVNGKLVAVTDAGLTRTTVGTLPGAVSALQFASSSVGWAEVPGACAQPAASCPVRLFATADGGVTWKRLRPP